MPKSRRPDEILCPECGAVVARRHKDRVRQLRSHLAMAVLDPVCPRAIVFTCQCGCEFDASGIVLRSHLTDRSD